MIESIIEFSVEYKKVVLVVHAIAGAIGLGGAVLLDILFFTFLKDRKIDLQESKIANSIGPVFMYALLALYITGALLFASDITRYIESTKFLTKMLVVCVLTINGYLLHYFILPHLHKFSLSTRSGVKKKFTALAFTCGAISLTSWVTAFILGSVSVLPFPLWLVLALYSLFMVIVVVGSQIVLRALRG